MRFILLFLSLTFISGCARGPKTYDVQGKIVVSDGDIQQLVGSHVEAALTTDPTVRASGEIGKDGRFVLQTLHRGSILRGAPGGSYRVRIILQEDDLPRRREVRLAQRFLSFDTSGLTFDVPGREVVLTTSAQ